MTQHNRAMGCPREEAALYALDALDPVERESFGTHLDRCPKCRAEVESLRGTTASLGSVVPAVTPPEGLLARILSAVRPATHSPVANVAARAAAARKGGSDVVHTTAGDWEETGVEGVRMRSLFVDEANDRVTLLVRMDAGASYPSHRHGGAEECYVLEGDLSGPGFEMKAGDYQRRAAGTVHGTQLTRDGCLLFIVSSLHDEMLGARA